MPRLSKKQYDEYKRICNEKGITYESELEMQLEADKLVDFVKLMVELGQEEHERERRLLKEPKGFTVPSKGRTCSLCKQSVFGEVWYDKWGMRCMNCQAAYKRRIIPGYVFKDHDNHKHYTAEELHWRVGVHPQTLKKLIREGKLKPRIVPHGPTVFLKRDNPDLPKVLGV